MNEISYSNLSKFKLSNNERVPTLEDVINTIYNTSSNLIIEIKETQNSKRIVDSLHKILIDKKFGNRVILAAFDKDVLLYINNIAPEIRTMLLCFIPTTINNNLKIQYIAPHYITFLYHPEFIKKMHLKKISVFSWTVNSSQMMKYLIQHKVDGIITDRPDKLDDILNGLYKN